MIIPLLALGITAGPLLSAQADQSDAPPAGPGTVNYVEGAVSIDGQQISRNQIGDANLMEGDELTTGLGRAEILLTPGVFLRVDKNSAVKMLSPLMNETEVQLVSGKAAVEVDEIHNENDLQILDAGVVTRLQKTGYYEFDERHPEVMVFKGKADVELPDERNREVKGNHQFLLASAEVGKPLDNEKPKGLQDNRATDGLFNWSKLRSQYLAEANNQMADEYADAGDPGWFWDPSMMGYTFIGPGPFYSPFGWGFAPFGWGGMGWGWGGGWGGWYGGDRYYGHGHYYAPRGRIGGYRGGGFGHAGGFHGGGGGFHGGGFHGGGGVHGGR